MCARVKTVLLHRPPRLIAITLTLVIVGGLAACTTPEPPIPSGTTRTINPPASEPAPEAGGIWDQTIDWVRCTTAEGAECAWVNAPLDWANPEGETIELALARVTATDNSARLGSLLINPGGPGGSGKAFLASALASIGTEVQASFDIVGFDPRGVGDSTAVVCYTETAQMDEFFAATWPRTLEGFEQSLAVVEPFAQACGENTGPLLGHVDTESAAKDMDLLRALLGDEKLNYLGYSYGTALGAAYAELFPDKVGRMVLDGAIDPSVPADLHEVEQAAGFEAALGAYLDDCLTSSSCPFRGTKEQAKAQINQFLLDVEAKPMAVGSRELTQPLALNGIIVTLYSDLSWPMLSLALSNAFDYDDAAFLLELSDIYLERSGGEYQSNQMEAFLAINCLDARLATDPASVEAHAQALAEASPTIGEFWGYSEKLCEVWPYPQVLTPHAVSAPGANPIIVVGTTGDPATPYQGAVALAEQLESGVLITFEGEGHTAYGRSNSCVGDAIDQYFVLGDVPQNGLTC
ncbi:MAG: alpha/beta hydrolase [Bifidobacteriaceae bacterium]|jgi:pimeloyl-ACP methyl ester carboxylesterase|nr:alpha/beta hydrolase [Bifidobacteriaceae bacterium]